MAEQKEEMVFPFMGSVCKRSSDHVPPKPTANWQPVPQARHGSPQSTCLTSPWQGALDPRQALLPRNHGQAAWHEKDAISISGSSILSSWTNYLASHLSFHWSPQRSARPRRKGEWRVGFNEEKDVCKQAWPTIQA